MRLSPLEIVKDKEFLSQVSVKCYSVDHRTVATLQASIGNGVGIAAPQIGILKRIIYIDFGGIKQVMYNPKIVTRSKAKIRFREGCLSFPNKEVLLWRHRKVTVEGLDENFEPIMRKYQKALACIVQHEIDHLDGITI